MLNVEVCTITYLKKLNFEYGIWIFLPMCDIQNKNERTGPFRNSHWGERIIRKLQLSFYLV